MRLFTKIVTTIYLTLLYRVQIKNADKVPAEGAAIICGNHNGMLDMFFIGFKLKRWIHWMAKEELFKNPVAGAIFRALGAFPVKRGKGDVASVKRAYKLLEEGHIIGIFPQGTRVDPAKRKTVRIKPGAAMIAVNSGVPIVPVAIQGSYKPFSRVKIVFGEPFRLAAEKGRKYSSEELSQFSGDIMDKIYSLMED
jgi:1-acyl-sn-glycerol-3-phosphate acyltransferase